MTKQLTAAGIAKMRAGKQRREVRDANSGLSLIIHPSGKKSWAMRFRRPDGRPAKLTLGMVDLDAKELEGAPEIGMPLSLASARWLAAEINRQRAMGRDVIADLAAAKQRRRVDVETKAYTFPAAVRQFVNEYAKKNRGWRESAKILGLAYSNEDSEPQTIKGSLAERWRERAVSDVDGGDIFAAVDEARRQGIPGLSKRNNGLSDARGRHLGRALGKLFNWLHAHRKIAANPCAGMFVPPMSPRRDRRLSDDEVRLVWKHTGSLGYPFGPLIRLLLLTGARRDEVGDLRRDELSEDRSTWTIPAGRTKNKLEFILPLSSTATNLLEDARKFGGDSHFVFTTTGTTSVSGFSKIKDKLDEMMRKEAGENFRPWRIHDIRRTVASGMASIKIEPHVIEAVLNHVSGFRAGVAGIYNVHQYEDEKREALERWASHLDRLINSDKSDGNVVSIRKGRR